MFTGDCAGACGQQQPPPLTYQACALDGGAQLHGGALANLGRAQFKFTNASCNYPSRPSEGPHPHP